MNALKSILKFILYAGAVLCCLAGLWVIYVAVVNFREMQYPEWLFVLGLEAIFACLAFAPAVMLVKGLKTKMWHWIFIGIVEALVMGFVAYALFFLVAVTMTNPG
jgi:hypothetical protein